MNSFPPTAATHFNPTELPHHIIGACLEVHAQLGPGLTKEAYCECLAIELRDREFVFERAKPLEFLYKNKPVRCAAILDFVIEGILLVQVYSVDELEPLHKQQVFSYLQLSGCKEALLLNFNVTNLRIGGIKRLLLQAPVEEDNETMRQ